MQTVRILLLCLGVMVVGFMSPILAAKFSGILFSAESQPATPALVNIAAPSAPTASAPVAHRAEERYVLNCAPCHGSDGLGNPTLGAPALAGQKEWYLVRQLEKFRDGTRGTHPQDVQGMQMAPMLRLLPTDGDLQDVASYLAMMPPFQAAAALTGDSERGKTVYIGTCLPCHGEQGDGNPLLKAPMLAGQADWYLVRQLSKFKAGIRGAHKEDTEGMQMMAMASTLVDEQSMIDLAVYVNGLREVAQPAPAVEDVRPAVTDEVVAHGEMLFALNCAPCHQASGEGNPAFNAPALAGQKDWYLGRQLRNFRDGSRGAHPEDREGMQMAPMLRLLADDQAIDDVVSHMAALPPFVTEPTLAASAEQGKTLFVGTCMPCHGERAEGNPMIKAPRLAGQADWYLVRQITKFKHGIRGAHKDDALGMQMAAMAKTLIDEQSIHDLAAYINQLR